MLQRAASSARSWWLASHIRTKQSNWLEQNLLEMETRIQGMIKLIDADGDSFSKRAEMYYKRRPELIHFVEEFYKEYRGLADRYDHISGDLHNARSTIATAFPEQAPFVEPTERSPPSKGIKADSVADITELSNALSKNPPPPLPPAVLMKPNSNNSNVPNKVETHGSIVSEHAMDTAMAQKEIDKLQKQILALMMEKEFVKSSYEVGLAKYWETEEQILELQAKMCFLQEEYELGSEVDADEEHTILAVTALNSCGQVLGTLQEEQQKAMTDAEIESERIKVMEEKLKFIKDEFQKRHPDAHKMYDEKPTDAHPEAIKTLEEEVCNLRKENSEYQGICHKLVKQLEINVNNSLSIHEYSQLIDEIVSKVVELESEVSTQIVQIMRMKSEADHVQDNLQRLEEDKTSLLIDSKTMTERIKYLEDELTEVQRLNLYIEEEKSQLQEALAEACSKLEDLRVKFRNYHDHSGDQNLVLHLPPQKDANGSSMSHQNWKEGESSPLVGSETESVLESLQEKYVTEYSNRHQNHNQCEFSALVQSQNEDVLQPQELKDADEHPVSFQEGEISVQSGSESALGHRREGKGVEMLAYTETEEKGLNDVMLERGSDFTTELHEEIVKPKSEVEEHKLPEELFISELGHNVKQGMHPETDDQEVTSAANGHHKAKHENKAETDHKSSNNIAGGLENISLELVGSQAWISFLEGMEDREKTLLTEYTSILRSYKETKKKNSELEKQNHDMVTEKMEKIMLLEAESSRKDGEIHSLKQKLAILHMDSEIPNTTTRGTTAEAPPTEKEINIVFSQDTGPPSAMEEKFRHEIDALLDDNLEFWLRFSASFHQIKRFQTTIEEAQVEAATVRKRKEGTNITTDSNHDHQSMKSSVETIQKQMTELQGELIIWVDQNALLKEELKRRFLSLCDIQHELSQVSKTKSGNGEAQLTEYQAAKFQGEVLNMQQENNKVADELQAGLDHVRGLQLELEKTLLKLKENFGLPEGRRHRHNINHMRNTFRRTRIPLRSFLQIGGKPPKKPSLFSCVHPAFEKQR